VVRPLERGEATLYLQCAEALRRLAPRRTTEVWAAVQSACLVGAAGGWTTAACAADLRSCQALLQPERHDAFEMACLTRFALRRGDVPAAPLYLAVRAARRACAANPDDAEALMVLGESYRQLLARTAERAWQERLPPLVELRRAQATWALNQAIAIRPDLVQAHFNLGRLYLEMDYKDLALDHLQTYQNLIRRAGPPPGVSAEEFRATEEESQKHLVQLAGAVEVRKKLIASQSRGKVFDRAMLAARKGLAGKARDLLLGADIAAFGRRGMALELELLLMTGRARDVREWTTPELKEGLKATTYHWLRVRAFAALGDYALAEEEMIRLGAADQDPRRAEPRALIALAVAQAIAAEQPLGSSVATPPLRPIGRVALGQFVTELAKGMCQQADTTTVRGLLALEAGQVDEAEVAFRLGLAFCRDEAALASGGGLDFDARPIAQGCLQWLDSVWSQPRP